MEKAWNNEGKFFGQSYEDNDVLDSAVLIMPLVFFMHAVAYSLFLLDGKVVAITNLGFFSFVVS